MATNPTWYDILGVAPDATPEQIKAAWRAATDKFEPGSGTSQFRLFNEAADVLLDADRRRAYDAELGETPREAPAEPEPEPEPEAEAPPAPGPDAAPEAAATEATPEGVEPGPVFEPEPEPAVEAAPRTGLLGRLAAIPVLVLALLAVVAAAAIVLAVVVGTDVHDRVQVYDAGPDASAAAERALTSVLSYDYRHMEADRDRAAGFLTPAYRKQYLKNFNDLLTKGPDGSPGPAVKTQAVVKADVLDTGIVDAETDRVRVIVFVNQSSVKGTGQPTIFQDRVVATMVHRGDRWLVDNIKSY
jgi:Mce-associated membrane protein